MSISLYTYIYICTDIYPHIHICVDISLYICIYMYIYICICTYTGMYMYMPNNARVSELWWLKLNSVTAAQKPTSSLRNPQTGTSVLNCRGLNNYRCCGPVCLMQLRYQIPQNGIGNSAGPYSTEFLSLAILGGSGDLVSLLVNGPDKPY